MAKKTQQPNNVQMLKTAIREKNPDRLYFFHGEETFLLHHYLDQLKKLLLDDLTESFNFHKLTGETFDIRDFADAVENLPMMAESTLVWADDVDIFKLNESDREKMAEIFADIPDYCTVVFTFITVQWKPDGRQKKYTESINKNGTVVEFAKQELRDLIPWVTRHFAANKKRITPDLCSYLIEITGGTMTALSGEISKICAFSGADDIKKSDIDAVTEPVLDAVVFEMTDQLGQGEYGLALLKLRQLLKMQEEPLLILGAIGSHFLQSCRYLIGQGFVAQLEANGIVLGGKLLVKHLEFCFNFHHRAFVVADQCDKCFGLLFKHFCRAVIHNRFELLSEKLFLTD